jgi:tetratricopeptide (TPR) repeat protein
VLLTHKGIWLMRCKEFERARQTLAAALQLQVAQDSPTFAALQMAMGHLAAETDHLQDALQHFEAALAIDRDNGFYRGIADDLDQIGQVQQRLNQTEQALDSFLRSLKIYALLQEREAAARLLAQCQDLARQSGQDIGLVRFFADQWLERGAAEPLCP